jgi:MazG family protein
MQSQEPSAPDAADREPSSAQFERLLGLVARLRAPDGCAWDRAQTRSSLAPNLIEEAFELVEAIDRGDPAGECAEAGDVLINLCMLCQIAAEEGRFDLGRAAEVAGDKLIRRHPHVFGAPSRAAQDPGAQDPAEEPARAALARWESIKRAERAGAGEDRSALAGVPKALPALQRAQRLGAKAISSGFRWPDAHGAFAKLEEELAELAEAFGAAGALPLDHQAREAIAHELGDLLLAASQFANYVGLDAEAATRAAARRFEQRFRAVEARFDGRLEGRSLQELMGAWREAKQRGM